MREARDEAQLRSVLAVTGPVFLDFDGPVCRVYPDDLNLKAADQLRSRLREYGIAVPDPLNKERDPLAVLRFSASLGDAALLDDVERTLTGIELAAMPDATGTRGGEEFLYACADAGRPVVIVSNNATEAIESYLRLHQLTGPVQAVVGRPHAQPAEMKPNPRTIQTALSLVSATPGECVLVGDSVTDIEVARFSGIRSVAFVKAPDRRPKLMSARPDALVDSMALLALCVRQI
jgi:phosphoglycolate phosphatase-like HAD superfamily hydrolase